MRALSLAVVMLVLSSMMGARAEMSARAEPAVIVLAADPWCPHTCEADAPRPGYMIEIARRAFALSGLTVEYRITAWARAISDTREGRIDGVVGALASEVADLDLPQEALGHQSNLLVVRADDRWTLAGLDSLNGRTIGTVQNYGYSPQLDVWLAGHPDRVRALGGENALERNLRKLVSGRIDTVVEDEAVLALRLRNWAEAARVRVAGRVDGGDLYIAFSRRQGRGIDLARMLDQGVRTLRASGELNAILAAYGVRDWTVRDLGH
jgi:polar amino acid transport system substrate-binding protein